MQGTKGVGHLAAYLRLGGLWWWWGDTGVNVLWDNRATGGRLLRGASCLHIHTCHPFKTRLLIAWFEPWLGLSFSLVQVLD